MYYKKIFYIILFFLISPLSSLGMMCPTNFNQIELGYSMEQILSLCGPPDQRTQSQETISLSSGTGYNQTNGIYNQTRNTYQSQGYGNYQGLSDVHQQIIVYTRFFYNSSQPAVLTFKDGILEDRRLIPK